MMEFCGSIYSLEILGVRAIKSDDCGEQASAPVASSSVRRLTQLLLYAILPRRLKKMEDHAR